MAGSGRPGPGWLRLMAQYDISKARRHATHILTIRGNRVFQSAGSGQLGIIAVLGPAAIGGRKFKDALLMEIGLGPSRPYHMAKGKDGMIAARNRLAGLTPEQYQLVAPVLFRLLQEWVDERVAKWFCNPARPFKVKGIYKLKLSRRGSLKEISEGLFYCVTGRRFAVHRDDKLLLADLYWAFLHQLPTRRQVKAIAGEFNGALAARGGSPRIERKLADHLRERLRVRERVTYDNGSKQLVETCRSLQPYLLAEVSRYAERSRLAYWANIKQMVYDVGGYNGDLPEESRLAQSALPGVEKRVAGITLKDWTALRSRRTTSGRERDRNCIVFEFFPTDAFKNDVDPFRNAPWNSKRYKNDIPF